jgi:hypothetical protein
MSYIGSDFFCNNEECQCYEKSITLCGPWPLGNIDDLIEIASDDNMKNGLMRMKENGFEMAKINYPDPHNIKIVAYAHERYCPNCKRIQIFDAKAEIIEQENEENSIIETEEISVPIKCDCGHDYLDLEKATNEGIPCPFCNKKLKEKRWFVNRGEK